VSRSAPRRGREVLLQLGAQALLSLVGGLRTAVLQLGGLARVALLA